MQYLLETVQVALTQDIATYALPNRTIAIGVAYLTTGSGSSAFDRALAPISSTDYGAIPNKSVSGPPTAIWFNLQPIPQITLWPVPDSSGPYTLNLMSYRQQQDVGIHSGETVDTPYRFLDAFTAGLAARLARIYAPALYLLRKQDFEDAWQESTQRDQESVNWIIAPDLSGYMR